MLNSQPPTVQGQSAPLTASERTSLVASARALKQNALGGSPRPLLRGTNLGLVTEAETSVEAALFQAAAIELGARVVCIRPSVAHLATPEALRDTARVLGRLYAALECQGLPPSVVAQIRQHAGVPVFDNLAGSDHPSASLADELGGDPNGGLNRRCVLQAALLSALAAA